MIRKKPHLYDPEERVRWLVACHYALGKQPYTNTDKLASLERAIGIIVADHAADLLDHGLNSALESKAEAHGVP